MGIILVYGMVGMHQRNLTFLRDPFRHKKGRKFALGMHNVRLPLYDPAIQFASRGHPESGTRINISGIHGAHIDHTLFLIGMSCPRQGQGLHFMSSLL